MRQHYTGLTANDCWLCANIPTKLWDSYFSHAIETKAERLLKNFEFRNEKAWKLLKVIQISANTLLPSHVEVIFFTKKFYFMHIGQRSTDIATSLTTSTVKKVLMCRYSEISITFVQSLEYCENEVWLLVNLKCCLYRTLTAKWDVVIQNFDLCVLTERRRSGGFVPNMSGENSSPHPRI